MTSSGTSPIDPVDPVELAGHLRQSVFRLARLLHQQDDSGIAPALIAALATIEREGPITLGDLAEREQLSPPSITKAVDALEARGFVERVRDEHDRRVCRVRVNARGRRRLEASRTRRTAWLTTQLNGLDADELTRLAGAVEVLERLVRAPARAAT
ncbi:MAG: transcriptional regulator, MarR family [Actinomycetia bacterium]|nr:transcriptional regulator, MarR family [Actinomycetes bacterium]